MLRLSICCVLCAVAAACLAQELPGRLPSPHYQAKPSDPPWLEHVVQLHGHLGPWVVAGARLGMAGAQAADAKTHFDVDVTCEGPFVKPPQSCFLDGVQIGTGATPGKRNLHYVEAEQIIVKVRNTRTGKTVEVRPTQRLLELLLPSQSPTAKKAADQAGDGKAEGHHEEEQAEQTARDIAVMPDERILVISHR